MNTYNQIDFFYFSGTGNSKKVAQWMSEVSDKNKIPCNVQNIVEKQKLQYPKSDVKNLIVISSPIHGFNYPPIMVKFLLKMPRQNNPVILMNTRAGMKIGKWITPGLTGIAFYLAAFILFIKGYKVKGAYPIDMPSNWISLHPALNSNTINFINTKMKERVSKYTYSIINGKARWFALREIIQDIAISPISLGYFFIGRFIIAKTFYTSNSCNNCGLCVKKCPVNAIKKVWGRLYWKFTCESCMNCINSCPKSAIQTSHGFIFAVIVLYNVFLTSLIDKYFNHLINWFNPLVYDYVVQAVIFTILLFFSYLIFHMLLHFSIFEKIANFTSFTYFKLWGRYKSEMINKNRVLK